MNILVSLEKLLGIVRQLESLTNLQTFSMQMAGFGYLFESGAGLFDLRASLGRRMKPLFCCHITKFHQAVVIFFFFFLVLQKLC